MHCEPPFPVRLRRFPEGKTEFLAKEERPGWGQSCRDNFGWWMAALGLVLLCATEWAP